MTITTITIGGEDYTSYASVAEADVRLAVDATRKTAWEALTTDEKGANLVAATNRLDLELWIGEKTGGEGAQENKWARTGVTYEDGTAVSTTEVPIEVENATIILAGSIALDATLADSGTSGSNTKRVKAGSAEVTFFRSTLPGKPIQDETVFDLIRQFLEGSQVSSSTGNFASGTDASSEFCDEDAPGLSSPYP